METTQLKVKKKTHFKREKVYLLHIFIYRIFYIRLLSLLSLHNPDLILTQPKQSIDSLMQLRLQRRDIIARAA